MLKVNNVEHGILRGYIGLPKLEDFELYLVICSEQAGHGNKAAAACNSVFSELFSIDGEVIGEVESFVTSVAQ